MYNVVVEIIYVSFYPFLLKIRLFKWQLHLKLLIHKAVNVLTMDQGTGTNLMLFYSSRLPTFWAWSFLLISFFMSQGAHQKEAI